MHVLRCSAHQGIAGVGLDRFLAMAALNIGVECLAAHLASRIRLVGAAGGRGTRGMTLGAELGDEVARSDLSSWLVLFLSV